MKEDLIRRALELQNKPVILEEEREELIKAFYECTDEETLMILMETFIITGTNIQLIA